MRTRLSPVRTGATACRCLPTCTSAEPTGVVAALSAGSRRSSVVPRTPPRSREPPSKLRPSATLSVISESSVWLTSEARASGCASVFGVYCRTYACLQSSAARTPEASHVSRGKTRFETPSVMASKTSAIQPRPRTSRLARGAFFAMPWQEVLSTASKSVSQNSAFNARNVYTPSQGSSESMLNQGESLDVGGFAKASAIDSSAAHPSASMSPSSRT
mmetsp:Transcript_20121/g.68152  ORF Transcript_20121/g.68152 Transcript_20121/m.68152 type:complete len:217 (-) Transcript_20121:246-896(-)